MGYHVTILRTANGAQLPIELEEAKSAAQTLGWTFDPAGPAFDLTAPEGTCTLHHDDGELWVKTPDDWMLPHMIALATALQARVRGDELETYETPEQWYTHPDDIKLHRQADATSKRAQIRAGSTWRRGLLNAAKLALAIWLIAELVKRWAT